MERTTETRYHLPINRPQGGPLPPRSTHNGRTRDLAIVGFRVSRDERVQLDRAAKAAGLSLSEFIRARCLAASVPLEVQLEHARGVLTQLQALGARLGTQGGK